MDKINEILAQFGLSPKEIKVYLALLTRGPSSVRKVGEEAKINRGTTYDILKTLRAQGLVSYYHKEKRQYFVAEDPKNLISALNEKKEHLSGLEQSLKEIVPQLRSLNSTGDQPVVKYYEGANGIKTILKDVLDTVAEQEVKQYVVYSSANIRKYLYEAFPNFNDERLKREIKVKAVAFGEGGEMAGLDERKWLTKKEGAPVYQLIYGSKIALISVDNGGSPRGIIMEDNATATTQRMLFEHIWGTL
jgi:HTH-type transcriptional regulator, sugar sensing transcriptional regulator